MALRAIGTTYPNPPVGAVIVKNGIILSRGWTQPKGVPHAEIHAINQIKNKKDIKGANLYCTLEPCSHQGKTPPCVDKIIELRCFCHDESMLPHTFWCFIGNIRWIAWRQISLYVRIMCHCLTRNFILLKY